LPDLEQSKSAVLNNLTSVSSKRSYDHAIREFIERYCSEPRLAFNKVVVTRYRISLEQAHYASSTINLRLAAVRRLAYVLRRTCAKLCHEAGGELEQIQFLLGHFTGVIGATEA
jgi:site-specific recombinase XerD